MLWLKGGVVLDRQLDIQFHLVKLWSRMRDIYSILMARRPQTEGAGIGIFNEELNLEESVGMPNTYNTSQFFRPRLLSWRWQRMVCLIGKLKIWKFDTHTVIMRGRQTVLSGKSVTGEAKPSLSHHFSRRIHQQLLWEWQVYCWRRYDIKAVLALCKRQGD